MSERLTNRANTPSEKCKTQERACKNGIFCKLLCPQWGCLFSSGSNINGFLLLDHGLPLSLTLSDGEAVNLGLNLCPPLPHVVLNVKHERVLAKVGVHHLPWSLKAHGGIQVGLQRDKGGAEKERMEETELGAQS